jgi:hypothetical protein
LSHGEAFDDVAALAFHLRARSVLGTVLARLDAASIPVLVVKGAVLAHTLYPTPIDRPIRDIDLRVLPSDVRHASELLTATPGARLLVRSWVYGTSVVSVQKVEFDLESAIGPRFLCGASIAAMLDRAERTSEGLGFSHLRPELHDHLLLLCVNLFKDRLSEVPGWKLRDLELLARVAGFESRTLAALAEKGGCTTIVHVVARYMTEAAGDERWAEIADRIRPARPAYAERMLSVARGALRRPLFVRRLDARAGSDSRARSLAALGAAVIREVELRAANLRASLSARREARV